MSNPTGLHVMTAKAVTQLRRQYQDGARDCDLAHWFKVSEASVRYHTRDIRRPKVDLINMKRLAALAAMDLTQREIARRLGVHKDSVGRAIRRMKEAA
jgi:IS30 family transposase